MIYQTRHATRKPAMFNKPAMDILQLHDGISPSEVFQTLQRKIRCHFKEVGDIENHEFSMSLCYKQERKRKRLDVTTENFDLMLILLGRTCQHEIKVCFWRGGNSKKRWDNKAIASMRDSLNGPETLEPGSKMLVAYARFNADER